MKKQILKTALLLLLANTMLAQTSKNSKTVIKNEKVEEFTVTIIQKNDISALVQITKNGNTKPFVYNVDTDFTQLKSATDIVRFEDFNFDGEKEIVIEAFMNGKYIYDRTTGKPKNLFEKTYGYGRGNDESYVQNYIHTHRGEYEINNEEMTIKISGSCGAGCGSEETYKGDGTGNLKLTRKCEWNE